MKLHRTRAVLARVEWRESCPSTNTALKQLCDTTPPHTTQPGNKQKNTAPENTPPPHGTAVITTRQTNGRGRLNRNWTMPPDTAIAVSVLVRGFARRGLGPSWLPLLAGSALATTLQQYFTDGRRVGVKWPNDVQLLSKPDTIPDTDGLKLCGILCEMLDPETVIVGAGINLLIPPEQLPTHRATSLLAAKADRMPETPDACLLTDPKGQELADQVLAHYTHELLRLCELAANHPDAAQHTVINTCITLGTRVRVHLPSADTVRGTAIALADDGSLIVQQTTGDKLTISAGDIEHVRSDHTPGNTTHR